VTTWLDWLGVLLFVATLIGALMYSGPDGDP
jgi:hypothetical protein